MSIRYRFDLDQGPRHEFAVDIERKASSDPESPAWTALSHHQCPHCPLSGSATAHCPPAVDLQQIVSSFNEILSYQTARVTVETPERTIIKDCDVQTGLTALLGLIMASSACPVLSKMKGLTRTHLPFQSLEETQFRFIGAYFAGQLLRQSQGHEANWSLDGLSELFEQLTTLNQAFKARIQSAARQDATMNAVSTLAAQMMGVQITLEDGLEELAGYVIPTPDDRG